MEKGNNDIMVHSCQREWGSTAILDGGNRLENGDHSGGAVGWTGEHETLEFGVVAEGLWLSHWQEEQMILAGVESMLMLVNFVLVLLSSFQAM